MATSRPLPERLVFGPFELDITGRHLRKGGIPVRLSGQPFLILLMLLESPGEMVTREQLRERVWSTGIFVDFEGGLNAAINKLRRALGDSADNPRYIETVTGSGYRFIGALDASTAEIPPLVPSTVEDLPVRRRLSRWAWIPLAAAILIAVLLLRKTGSTHGTTAPLKLTRLTNDDGYANAPALSPDGKFLAYSSGPGFMSKRDLFVKAIAGGPPVRLTFDGTVNTAPGFSPDGTRIVFQSMRNGPGIYEIPAFGGEARLIVQNGFDPIFSPDGTEIAYWMGAASVAESVPGSSSVWIVPAAGGKPRRVGAQLATARYPIWSRDGRHLLINGYSSSETFDKSAVDWWFVSASGDESIRTGVYQALSDAGLATGDSRAPVPTMPVPQCWSSQDDKVTFSARSGDTSNLWRIGVSSATGKVTGSAERLTIGAGNDTFAACTDKVVAFASNQTKSGPWLMPFDFTRRSKADLQKIAAQASRESLSLTANGRFLTFASDQSGEPNIWLRDLASGKESIVASSPFAQRYPLSNESGTRVAYSAYENDKRVLYISALGGPPEKLCEGCLRATDWAEDDKRLIVFGGNPYTINLLDLASRQQSELVKHPKYNVLYGRVSPDRHWISFTARIGAEVGRIAIAPLDNFKPVAESSWIPIADAGTDDYAMWSPDGETLYYTSSKDGHACLWGQRLDSTHKPSGEPFSVQHFHGETSFGHGGWAVGEGLFAITLVEAKGNIWMLSR